MIPAKLEEQEWARFLNIANKQPFLIEVKDKRMNKLISIGYTGQKTCYLNISREEAVAKYLKSEYLKELGSMKVDEFEFDTEFGAYDVWETEEPIQTELDPQTRDLHHWDIERMKDLFGE